MIGDEVKVTIVDIRGDKVRVGIEAPRSISVHRKEIYDQIARENRAAALVKPEDLTLPVTQSAPPIQVFTKIVEISVGELRDRIRRLLDSESPESADQGLELWKQYRDALKKAA